MAKESSLQIFPIDLFVKGAYHVVKILHKCNGMRRNNRLLIWNNFYKENIVFLKLFETCFVSNSFTSLTEFQCQSADIFDFIWVQTFEIHIQDIFYINNAWILL